MRQIVLDTETTGLDPAAGHRIIEIGCLEVVNRRVTGERLHEYLQPDREIDAGAVEVHGITNEFLRDKPRFGDVVERFLEFVDGAELVIHNAPFDLGFINHELQRVGARVRRIEEICQVLDTLVLARQMHPGTRNSLDALCRRYQVDASGRVLHGAVLDAELLAEVYLAMTGGQVALGLDQTGPDTTAASTPQRARRSQARLPVIEPGPEELAAHAELVALLEQSSGVPSPWRHERS
ncbi:DNA polymerase III subunit epsilon [Thioalkalivibrio paradoxus]|uniref:DNA polymerase III subunit epsilon n=1 Tax=Thioalkalivibrio paradoxus ARh 1 TaxID=713585 RepID=W0DKC7_9GAMM|nr:DNA polymerase III subunit epsilon [Thioalkalivibrio paradoxus]AHE99054.1 DNA polymerase III subunit epsilon [Thioalkalivibrio paradoxus ARh 1]